MASELIARREQGTHHEVILFQEGFTKGVKKNLVNKLKYPYYIKASNAVLQNPGEKKLCKRRGAPNNPEVGLVVVYVRIKVPEL